MVLPDSYFRQGSLTLDSYRAKGFPCSVSLFPPFLVALRYSFLSKFLFKCNTGDDHCLFLCGNQITDPFHKHKIPHNIKKKRRTRIKQYIIIYHMSLYSFLIRQWKASIFLHRVQFCLVYPIRISELTLSRKVGRSMEDSLEIGGGRQPRGLVTIPL